MRRKLTVGATAAFCSTVLDSILRRYTVLSPVLSSFDWHHFVDRSLAASSTPRHRDGKAQHRVILTVRFHEEHVDGSPEEFRSLVPARVQQ